MWHYIVNNIILNLTLGLEVIPDYTKVLSMEDMKNLLNELDSTYQCILDFHYSTSCHIGE